MKITAKVLNTCTNKTSKSIPKHLYHFTTKQNWNEIQKTGKVKTSAAEFLNGIFTIDAKNLLTQWTKPLKSIPGMTAAETLIGSIMTQRQTGDLVLLKIPTTKLDIKELCFRKIESFNQLTQEIFIKHQVDPFRMKEKGFREELLEKLPEKFEHLIKGEDINNLSKSIKNEPVEIIYKKAIPLEDVEAVGSQNGTLEDTASLSLRDLWQKLTNGKDEAGLIKHSN